MIVKCQLCAGLDILISEYSNPGLSLHSPLPCLTVGVAAVVDEAGLVGFLPSIDDQALVECEHVEVVGVALMRSLDSLLAHFHVKNLTDVLDHKIANGQILVGFQAPPPTSCVERYCLGILTLLHALVLTESADGAVSWVAFDVNGSVDTGGVVVAWVLWCALAG